MNAMTASTTHLRAFTAFYCMALWLSLISWMNWSGSFPFISAVMRIPESRITYCLLVSQSRLNFFFSGPNATPASS